MLMLVILFRPWTSLLRGCDSLRRASPQRCWCVRPDRSRLRGRDGVLGRDPASACSRLVSSSAAAIGVALVSYNRAYLGRPTGYYSQFDAANFATPFLEGLEGTLLSPSRGLFVFTPWTIVAFAYLPFAFVQLRKATLLPWLIATLVVHAVLISTFTMWWAGHCFGPRFWTEAIPLIAIGLGHGASVGEATSSRHLLGFVGLVAASIAVQILRLSTRAVGKN